MSECEVGEEILLIAECCEVAGQQREMLLLGERTLPKKVLTGFRRLEERHLWILSRYKLSRVLAYIRKRGGQETLLTSSHCLQYRQSCLPNLIPKLIIEPLIP